VQRKFDSLDISIVYPIALGGMNREHVHVKDMVDLET
jgi:hypothetical protein